MHAALELTGIFAFGLSGALLAIRRNFDVVGIALLAVLTALGGGIARDLLLGAAPPLAFTRWEFLGVSLAAAAFALVAHPELDRLMRPLLISDAAGLGLFCVSGTVTALDHGLAPPAAAVLGLTTAVGGGVMRDVVARETPHLVRPESELYAIPALLGAAAVALAWEIDAYEPVLGAITAGAVFGVRVLALHHHWHGPRAWRQGHEPAHDPAPAGEVL